MKNQHLIALLPRSLMHPAKSGARRNSVAADIVESPSFPDVSHVKKSCAGRVDGPLPMNLLVTRGLLYVVLPYALLCLPLCSCKKDSLLPNEKSGTTDLSIFIFTEIAKYGGSNTSPARVALSGLTNYVYSEDKDGFQVLCLGNSVAALHSIFQPEFGNPALSTTNTSGLVLFVYSVKETGLAINCGLHAGLKGGTTQEVTQLAAVKLSALK